MKKVRITLTGENAEMVERLCTLTGLNPQSLIALLLRKSGRDLESWLGTSLASTRPESPANSPPPALSSMHYPEPPPELPQDTGDGWKPIEL